MISTAFPEFLKEALESGDAEGIEQAVEEWDPVVPVHFDHGSVDETIQEFGEVVDCIENRDFSPPNLTALRKKVPDSRSNFATQVCRNCDARFSCSSYRKYAVTSKSSMGQTFREYYADLGDEGDIETRKIAGLDVDE